MGGFIPPRVIYMRWSSMSKTVSNNRVIGCRRSVVFMVLSGRATYAGWAVTR
jgi:hypothetical protein